MGVLTTGVIPAGKVFGPIPPNLTLTDPALLIGHMTCDNRPDVHTVKVWSFDTSVLQLLNKSFRYSMKQDTVKS